MRRENEIYSLLSTHMLYIPKFAENSSNLTVKSPEMVCFRSNAVTEFNRILYLALILSEIMRIS